MHSPHGSFIWYELVTSDTGAAGRFYADVFGWSVTDFPGEGPPYRILSAGSAFVGGMMAMPPAAAGGGMRPGWLGYVAVDDVDGAIASITAAGGAVRMPATDLPNVGRIAMVADPQGAPFYVMRGASDQASTAFDPVTPGHCSWNELATTDTDEAMAFYIAQFGWTPAGVMPMGEMGDYRFLNHEDRMIGAMMRRQRPELPPAWQFYMRVTDVDAAMGRAVAGGATVLHGPVEVPGGDHIVVATDPQGATFAMVGARPSQP